MLSPHFPESCSCPSNKVPRKTLIKFGSPQIRQSPNASVCPALKGRQ